MAPEHRRTRVRRLAVGAAAVALATLACGPAQGVEVVRAAGPRAPAPSPPAPVPTTSTTLTVPAAVAPTPAVTAPTAGQAPAQSVPVGPAA
ncbi:hypothetical protein ACWEGQ_38135, partial [Streptomyces seoulensis]